MRLSFCVACGETDARALEHHHLVPRSKGGGDDETNIITLCGQCHGKAHGMRRGKDIRELTRLGLQKAKKNGVRLGSRDKERLVTARARKAEIANSRAKNIAAVISDIERAGIKTLAGIAEALSARGIKTPRGNESWAPTQVARIKAMAS